MEILGHRGARGEAPENTLPGFRHLRDLGIRAVEFDIQVAADGTLVVIHDDSVDRTTNGTGPLSGWTAPRLSLLDACHHRLYRDLSGNEISWPESEGIPTLQQVLDLIPDFHHLQLEVKARADRDVDAVVRQLPAMWRPFGSRAVTTSFNTNYLLAIRHAAPDIPRGFLIEKDFDGDAVQTALSLGCVSLGPHFSLITPELVRAAHDAGLKVSTWTVNDPEDMLRLRAWNVDSLITDFPALALQTLGG